ncbi:MAG: valine--tRNA ligase, partial [Clostridia bacterium]|nr:valine--tRNA ligase [Clostridia bacterium]
DGHMTGAADKAEYDELIAAGKGVKNEPEVLDCGKYAGMTTEEARKVIVADLQALGLLKEVEPLKHEVGVCYRHSKTAIEPMISKQWFVEMKPVTDPAIAAVKEGKTQFVPERFTKNYMNWMENIRDWCISRQLWWGHRIPVWYCDDCGEMMVLREDPCCCSKCGSKNIHQDEDVLDTWFSSALWPFSTLGWPENTEDLKYFYPTDVLVTGYDIITFWVSRMITMGIEGMEETPFHTVLIHGLVRDALGRKMSKSLGNGVDPLEVIDQYGADALRFSLSMGVSPGNDMRFSTDKVEAARNFANKIWNASRFVLMNLGETAEYMEGKEFSAADKWILARLNDTIRVVTDHFENYDLGMAAQKIYDFAWTEFCDWYIELAKVTMNGENEAARKATCAVLRHVLIALLKMLHPFMPFITDSVFRHVPATEGTIMLSSWPVPVEGYDFAEAAREMEGVMDVIRAVRNLRAEMNVAVGKRAHLMVRPKAGWEHAMEGAEEYLKRLAWVSEMQLLAADEAAQGKVVSAVSEAAELFIPLGDLVDLDKEIARLTKERDSIERDIQRAEGKLNNQGFLAKAPAQLVEQEKAKLEVSKDKLVKLNARIDDLKNM